MKNPISYKSIEIIYGNVIIEISKQMEDFSMNFSRLNRIREKMLQFSMGHLVITSPDAIFYLIDEEIHPGERLLALSLTQTK